MRVLQARLLLCATVLAVLLSGCGAPTGNRQLPEERVLFIGNSFTFFNGGIDQVLRGLAPNTRVDSATAGGYTLQKHLSDANTMGKLRQGGWTRVVIQEQSQYPVVRFSGFLSSARRLATEARKRGATPLLLMTWARPDSKGVTTSALKAAFTRAGRSISAEVIPAGSAFSATLAAHPGFALNQNDGHPTREGTYLAGCVTYAIVFGASPVGNTFTGGLDPRVAATLQAEAAKATGH
jgi:hypothetical protein